MVWDILKEYSLILEEIFLLYALFHIGIKKEKRSQMLFLCILALIAMIRTITVPDWTNRFIIFEILDFIAFCTIVKLPFLKKITFYCLSYFICGLIEVFIMWLIKNETSDWKTEISRADFFQLRISLCLFLLIIGKIRWKEAKEKTYLLKNYWYISLVTCLFGTLLAGFLFSETPYIINDKKIIFQFSIIFLGIILFVNTAGIISLVETRRLDKEKINLQTELLHIQQKYYTGLTEKQSALRKMKHDIKAHLTTLDLLNRNNEHKEVQAYLDKLLFASNIISYSDYDTGNRIANIIVNYFADLSKENNIIFDYDGHFEEGLKMTELEITSLLYNVLSNAFEECLRLPDNDIKKITLNIKNLHKTLMIVVHNFCRRDISEGLVNNLVTSKKNKQNHGFGIKIIKLIVADYDGEIKFKCEGGVWTVEMMFLNVYI